MKLVQAGLTRPLFNSGSSISKSPKLLYLEKLDIIEEACSVDSNEGTQNQPGDLPLLRISCRFASEGDEQVRCGHKAAVPGLVLEVERSPT